MLVINTLFIVALFAVWVWTLKQDIEHLRRSPQEPDESLQPTHPASVAPVEKPEPPKPLHHAYETAAKTRNRSGVPTWTIA
jgi:hypothetical protein